MFISLKLQSYINFSNYTQTNKINCTQGYTACVYRYARLHSACTIFESNSQHLCVKGKANQTDMHSGSVAKTIVWLWIIYEIEQFTKFPSRSFWAGGHWAGGQR